MIFIFFIFDLISINFHYYGVAYQYTQIFNQLFMRITRLFLVAQDTFTKEDKGNTNELGIYRFSTLSRNEVRDEIFILSFMQRSNCACNSLDNSPKAKPTEYYLFNLCHTYKHVDTNDIKLNILDEIFAEELDAKHHRSFHRGKR